MADIIGEDIGRYHILSKLGSGGMAIVYKAYDSKLDRDVALKLIRIENFPPVALERLMKRFEIEALALARLSHPNIVKVYDYGEYRGAPYLVMELVEGGTLKKRIGKPIPFDQAAAILLPIADALSYAHENNIIHRDVKPSNILFSEQGEPILMDFGIAKILEDAEGTTLTGTGMGVGTPEYMAPEQGVGGEADGRADVYSLGIVYFEMITGKKPYTADTPMAVIVKQQVDPLPRPASLVPSIPAQAEQVIYKALAKKAENRYETMSTFGAALEMLASGAAGAIPARNEAELGSEEETRDNRPTPTPVSRTGSSRGDNQKPSTGSGGWQRPRTNPTSPNEEGVTTPKKGKAEQPKRRQGLWLAIGLSLLGLTGISLFIARNLPRTGKMANPQDAAQLSGADLTQTHSISMASKMDLNEKMRATETALAWLERMNETEMAATKTKVADQAILQVSMSALTTKVAMIGLTSTAKFWTPTPTASFTPSATFTPTITNTPTITLTPTASATATITNTPTCTFTATATATPSMTFTPTITSMPTASFTPSMTFTPTITNTPTCTFTPTASFTPSMTFTPTATNTPTATSTPTLGVGSTRSRETDGMLMLYVPAGDFVMGDKNGAGDEKPAHTAYLNAYWIDQHEVTNEQYQKCVENGACTEPEFRKSYTRASYFENTEFDDYPVIYVNWHQAKDYCAWVDADLPTEAQWEKAARGTDKRTFPWGNRFEGWRLNYCDNNCEFDRRDKTRDDGYADTAPVCSYPAGNSPYGACDMAGNVWEWVNDWYAEDFYDWSPPSNPQGFNSGSYRVLRGGSWASDYYSVRVVARYYNYPTYSVNYWGFRCARSY